MFKENIIKESFKMPHHAGLSLASESLCDSEDGEDTRVRRRQQVGCVKPIEWVEMGNYILVRNTVQSEVKAEVKTCILLWVLFMSWLRLGAQKVTLSVCVSVCDICELPGIRL